MHINHRPSYSLYNGIVLPHLQYCLIVWGDFQGSRNKIAGSNLLRLQKRFVGMAAGCGRRVHTDPLFAKFGVLKIGDLYKQQLRIHGWQFWNGRLPIGQAVMLQRVSDTHRYGTRATGSNLAIGGRDQGSICYRVPKEWATITEAAKQLKSIAAFKRNSKTMFITEYKKFQCNITECGVCGQTT